MDMEGKLILFEGGEKAGKSTQIKILAERLKESGVGALVTKEPGGTEEGKEIRQKLLYGNLPPKQELDLFIKDRTIHFGKLVLPALARGDWVLCDRSSPSTIAYQHYGRGMNLENIRERDRRARQRRDFDLIILLDMEPQKAMARTERETIFEKENWEFHDKVRQGYLEQANNVPEQWLVLDASESVENVSEKIWQEIQKRFKI